MSIMAFSANKVYWWLLQDCPAPKDECKVRDCSANGCAFKDKPDNTVRWPPCVTACHDGPAAVCEESWTCILTVDPSSLSLVSRSLCVALGVVLSHDTPTHTHAHSFAERKLLSVLAVRRLLVNPANALITSSRTAW
jgi:hypothetical protein